MDEVYPTSSKDQSPPPSTVIADDEYNIPKNVINPHLAKEVRDAVSRDSSINLPLPSTTSPTHRPLLLPTSKSNNKVPQITISLSPPTEETNGELVSRELFRLHHKPSSDSSWKGSTLIAALVALLILLTIIFLLLLFQHI